MSMAGWWTIRAVAPDSPKAAYSASPRGDEGSQRVPVHVVDAESDWTRGCVSAVEQRHRHDAFTDDMIHEIEHGPFLARGGLQQLVGRDVDESPLELGTGTSQQNHLA
jgi:hypothetical protein